MNVLLSIIVTYNCDASLTGVVDAVYKQGAHVLIVDNGSAHEVFRLRSINEKASFLFNATNMGIGFALNQGVSYAREREYKWILTLDQDSLVTPGMVECLLNVYESLGKEEKEKTAGLFAIPIERALAGPGDFKSEPDNRRHTKVKVGITSGNMLRTEIFEKVGLFNEKLFIDYVDHDFCLRLASAGYQLLECEGAKLIHQRGNYMQRKVLGRLTETSNHSALRKYYITRNRMYIWKTYGSSHPDFVRHDKKAFRKQLLKLLLVEDNKWAKIKMVAKGAMDCSNGRFGNLDVSKFQNASSLTSQEH